jgi:hypothetical protein
MEAVTIIQLHQALERKFPTTQFHWNPSTSGTKYRNNVEMQNSTETIVDAIEQYCGQQELTIHDN